MITPPLTIGAWRILFAWDGVIEILDENGKARGKYADVEALAERMAIRMQYCDRLKEEIAVLEEQLKVACERSERPKPLKSNERKRR